MPKVKPKRKGVLTDMTAMCDVAFLLLTFFILTTKFKPDEPIIVDTPSSVSEIVLPESDVMLISISDDGKVFFTIDGQQHRIALLEKMGSIKGMEFTEREKYEFSLMSSFGMSTPQLKSYLALEPARRKDFKQPGMPIDSGANELNNWVLWARNENPRYRIAVKGDKDMNFKTIKRVIDILQDQNVNKFNLVTNMEAMPENLTSN